MAQDIEILILGGYRDNGAEHGNYYNGLYRAYRVDMFGKDSEGVAFQSSGNQNARISSQGPCFQNPPQGHKA